MSRIDELIARFCPDGVPTEPLGSIGTWYGGGTPSKAKAEYWEGGDIPWVSPKDMGRRIVDSAIDSITEIAVRESSTKLVPPTSVAMVVRSSILDRIFPSALVPVPVSLNQDMKAVVPREGILAEFVAHLLSSRGSDILRTCSKSGGSVTSINSPQLFAFRIPVPPLEVQREIVRILDQFTQLEAELEAELEARRRQYDFYRDSLLSLPADTPIAPLGELGTIFGGLTGKSKADFSGGNARYATYTNVFNNIALNTEADDFVRVGVDERQRSLAYGDVIFTGSSESLEEVGMTSVVTRQLTEPLYLNSFCIGFRMNEASLLNPEFAKHLFRSGPLRAQITKTANGVTRINVSKVRLAKILVPLPPTVEQERIARILDRFEALTGDLRVGLPAELAARRKQYEYYRDKLLTFEEATV